MFWAGSVGPTRRRCRENSVSAVLRAWCAEVAQRERSFRAPCLLFMSDQLQNCEMADQFIFYTHPMSRGRIVRWMLEEIGQPYRTELLDYDTNRTMGRAMSNGRVN